jgi:acyl-CoA synthetase (AMP-forming)/AMP-acid ligase II
MSKFDPNSFLELVEKEKCTHAMMVPTQYIVIMAQPKFDKYDLTSLEMLASGSAPLRANTKSEIIDRFKCKLVEIYGLSEGPGTMLSPEDVERKMGSVGKPVLGYDIRIINEDGQELSAGEVGEIVGYGAFLMKEYYKQPEKTAEVIWKDELGRTYLKTGDVGLLDEEGYLYILDRKKDMIISGGMNIFASDIEGIIGKHEAVFDVAVIGVPHDKWGETPIALVIPKKGSEVEPDDIKIWANERLAKYQRVAWIEFRQDFPRNPGGKVLKRELRQPYWEKINRRL